MTSKEVLIRAAKTFVQAFLAALAVSAVSVINLATAKAALLAAVAAGISAAWNIIIPAVKQ